LTFGIERQHFSVEGIDRFRHPMSIERRVDDGVAEEEGEENDLSD